MKKLFLSLTSLVSVALATQCFMSCAQEEPETAPVTVRITPPDEMDSVTITFSCEGDFVMSQFPALTRGELTADGKQLTDLWVLDYMDGSLAQAAIHQVSTDADFGTPTLNLTVGDHHIYFVASRGQNPTLSTDAHTLSFTRVLDTFYKDLSLNVTATSSGNRAVTLERCVTKLTIVFEDAIPEGAATLNFTPASWYYALDYLTGNPAAATASQTITVNIPASNIGQSGIVASIWGFSSTPEWTTDIALNCKTSADAVLGQATISDVPLKRNRVTTYRGPLFSASDLTSVSLSTEWDTPIDGTW